MDKNLIKELQDLATGMMNSNTLLLRKIGPALECRFTMEGIERHRTIVKCEILAEALLQKSTFGILEGAMFVEFKNSFDSFSLHVKAMHLYNKLNATLPLYIAERQNLAVA
jgi:hypothetical protein